ncbi:MAG: class I adenylate-forming enzyme family protein [Pseudolabrys sp.]
MSGALAQILGDGLKAAARIDSTDGEARTGAGLIALADRVAQALASQGVASDEPVLVRIGNRPADLGALLGIWRAGAVAVPLSIAAAPATFDRHKSVTGARFLVDEDRLETLGSETPPTRPLLRDAALIMFTSGTTGLPKGAVVGHARFAAKLPVLDRLLGISADDVVLVPLQLSFIYGLWVALLALMKNARLVLVPKFSVETIGGSLRDATVIGGVPSMYRALLLDNVRQAPKLRTILTGGEVLPPGLARRLQGILSAAIYDLYGLTETGTCDFCLKPADQPQGFGAIGHSTERIEFRIAPDGELQIKSPFGMLGYLDEPELTADSFAESYFKTGDLARLNADGFVELIGRAKEIISRGGVKIAPLEIDHLLAEHPDVAAALCAGVPDERLGEVIHAVVVPRTGAKLDAAALRDWLVTRTERYKVPEVFYFCDALPAGSTGKGDRKAVARLSGRA